MMEGRPFKFRILEIMAEGPCWNCDIVPRLQEEYNMPGTYCRDCLNFDLIEVASCGMITEEETEFDEEGKFRKGHLLIKYHISPIGIEYLEDLKKKARHRKGE